MSHNKMKPIAAALAFGLFGALGPAAAATFVQCPGDLDGDAVSDIPDSAHPDAKCMHLTGSDGFVTMADGRRLYMFSFADVTGVAEQQAIDAGTLAANFSAPTIVLDQGQEFLLSLTNTGMQVRPDLFDPHSVHFHGFPNASDIFDGLPEATISINQGSTLTYYYNLQEPGTHMYHCHVEATEHMQMGMLGNLYVRPAQNKTGYDADPATVARLGGNETSAVEGYVFNDGDGATAYDVEYPIQIGSFDGEFHQASEDVQPLPFAGMVDKYPMLNGRGYPDSANRLGDFFPSTPGSGANPSKDTELSQNNPFYVAGQLATSQRISSLIEVDRVADGPRLLLRISNLNVTNFYTLTANGLTMKVVGTGARILRGGGEASGTDFSYDTSSVTLGGGEAIDVIIDTSNVAAGTYFLYTTNLNFLSNDGEDFGGMMTEIVVN
ncbi:MAG: multicopper oxidase domain-containing protein [Gammaproteobacteria bacterium]